MNAPILGGTIMLADSRRQIIRLSAAQSSGVYAWQYSVVHGAGLDANGDRIIVEAGALGGLLS